MTAFLRGRSAGRSQHGENEQSDEAEAPELRRTTRSHLPRVPSQLWHSPSRDGAGLPDLRDSPAVRDISSYRRKEARFEIEPVPQGSGGASVVLVVVEDPLAGLGAKSGVRACRRVGIADHGEGSTNVVSSPRESGQRGHRLEPHAGETRNELIFDDREQVDPLLA